MDKRIFYSATLIVGDGSDTSVYGDGCEPGCGQAMTSGWWNPDWSTYAVYEDHEAARPDVYVDERHLDTEEPGPAEWLAERLEKRLGAIDRHSVENWREKSASAIYACESISDLYEDKAVTPAAHPEGFTAEEYAEAWTILDRRNCLF